MVERQVVRRGVRDPRVLAALRKVPRHEFVPEDFRHHAYEDRPLPIGQGQTISQPYMVAAMTEALLGPGPVSVGSVLEVGTGSGYQAAVLAELAARVHTVEIVPELSARARRTLARLGYRNVRLHTANGRVGWPVSAPYDRVMVTAGAETMPYRLVEQLGDGGRIVVPVGRGPTQSLVLGVKRGGRLVQRRLFDCVFVPFVRGREGPAGG
ncbi:MAG TPA: protein-L-isoaspartate(D-aspartate) O-methyltransferase [candidate division WOR-3 bacterium]|uniref:Protein-L-isoaspartate O-methyltransferase n=1 Tax=candidate division WOR-3 bacterium TaxID=2052148 RepID=A0A7V0XE42_UNCW3|nr:protein-L-isoaspartate(D-aspartate) O-methyltransferase [candidate division WOR-3 bacterium]